MKSLVVAFAGSVIAVIAFAQRRLRQQVSRVVAARALDLSEAVSLAQTEGFIVIDYSMGSSWGLGRPTVWWCPGGVVDESTELLHRLRDQGRIVVKNGRPVARAAKELQEVPRARIIESRMMELP